KARDFVQAIRGKYGVRLAHKVEESVKGLLVPRVILEELGLRYYGPIDGHDIPLLIRTFEFPKTQEEPVLLHILTKKGKGYAPALKQPDNSMVSANTRSRAARLHQRLRRHIRKLSAKRSPNLQRRIKKLSPSQLRCRAGLAFRISPRRTLVVTSMSVSRRSMP